MKNYRARRIFRKISEAREKFGKKFQSSKNIQKNSEKNLEQENIYKKCYKNFITHKKFKLHLNLVKLFWSKEEFNPRKHSPALGTPQNKILEI